MTFSAGVGEKNINEQMIQNKFRIVYGVVFVSNLSVYLMITLLFLTSVIILGRIRNRRGGIRSD